jgi:hypothetical protein
MSLFGSKIFLSTSNVTKFLNHLDKPWIHARWKVVNFPGQVFECKIPYCGEDIIFLDDTSLDGSKVPLKYKKIGAVNNKGLPLSQGFLESKNRIPYRAKESLNDNVYSSIQD